MISFRDVGESVEREVSSSDSELVQRCLQGEQTAWTQLIARYERLIYSVARTICFDSADVADVFQATCLELYKGLAEIRDIKALPAWLMTVTRRRAYGLLRTKGPVVEGEGQEIAVGNALKAIEEEHAIERALEQLPPRCRDLINMLYFNAVEPSYAEISEQLGIPVASIGPTRARCLE